MASAKKHRETRFVFKGSTVFICKSPILLLVLHVLYRFALLKYSIESTLLEEVTFIDDCTVIEAIVRVLQKLAIWNKAFA